MLKPILIASEKVKISSGLSEYFTEIQIITWSKSQIFLRAGTKALALSLVTLIGALIPVLHFFLIPFGLISTIYIFFRELKNIKSVQAGGVACPECQLPINFSKHNYNFPIDIACSNCERLITISKGDAS